MQKWEYALLRGVESGFHVTYPVFFRLTSRGLERVTDFRKLPEELTEKEAVAMFVAQLGEEGWEMVGPAISGDLFFKRPRP